MQYTNDINKCIVYVYTHTHTYITQNQWGNKEEIKPPTSISIITLRRQFKYYQILYVFYISDWIVVGHLRMIPLTIIPVTSNWGHYNLSIYVYIYTYIYNIYLYIHIVANMYIYIYTYIIAYIHTCNSIQSPNLTWNKIPSQRFEAPSQCWACQLSPGISTQKKIYKNESKQPTNIHGCVWKCCVPLNPMVNDHYPY